MNNPDLVLIKQNVKQDNAKTPSRVPCQKGVPVVKIEVESNICSNENNNTKLTWREVVELSKGTTRGNKKKKEIKNYDRSHEKTWLWDLDNKIFKDTMKSTTKLMLEEGANTQRRFCLIERKLINFTSFDMKDGRYGSTVDKRKIHQPLTTTYSRQFTNPYRLLINKTEDQREPKVDKRSAITEAPDYIFNRLPKNDFDPKAGQGSKFLDDHMYHISESRKKINFFRQIRNQSFVL